MDIGSFFSSTTSLFSRTVAKKPGGQSESLSQTLTSFQSKLEVTSGTSPADKVASKFTAMRAAELKKQLSFYSMLARNPDNNRIASSGFDAVERDLRSLTKALQGNAKITLSQNLSVSKFL